MEFFYLVFYLVQLTFSLLLVFDKQLNVSILLIILKVVLISWFVLLMLFWAAVSVQHSILLSCSSLLSILRVFIVF